jgi:hypothetical protein
MGLDPDAPLADKQAAAGPWLAAKRRSDTDEAIAAAVQSLRAAGKPVTQAAVAEASGKGIATIKRRWAAVTAMQAEPAPAVPVPEATAPRPVLVSLPTGVTKPDGAAVRNTQRSRAEAWRRFRLAALTSEVEVERSAGAPGVPAAGNGRPPIPAFLVAVARMKATG